ncbi:hypothetical protein ASPWEDRAFT_67270 [Aspergillus wentii DTO 134E9]|uniref:Signal peptidase complex catalytic subunit SEC11 n=1 Tax=Aspergillus wentii DTO 134E9 TaxID=1073089 RepID=A0A1L9RQ52_ASPWE|nr:uncharacterized protein ASPWEDRAFT_67270 [Aspergillus wentii DTO 134E9]KAI9923918.1 hypothetical protein MW887_008223 [Aspergillus wentii]OJJ36947.1 hypothetical protein ASPWEDRAFT_67270 [Aspergillus wentii DTO 134E9]
MKTRRLLTEAFPVLWAIASIFMAWKALCALTGTAHPIMVVTSESMSPAFHRGDLILLWNRKEQIQAGDIPVVWFPGRPLPMVHRAIKVSQDVDNHGLSRQVILTKGDNNVADDVGLYPGRRTFVYRDEIIGLVRGYVPSLGWASLVVKTYPWVMQGASVAVAVGMVCWMV